MTTDRADEGVQEPAVNSLDLDEPCYANTESSDATLSASTNHLSLTRRAFIGGAAGTVASTSVAALPSTAATFAIDETAVAITVRFLNEKCLAPLEFVIPKVYWRGRPRDWSSKQPTPQPTFTVVDKVAPPQPDGVVRRSATITVSQACFVGMSKISRFEVRFEFTLVDQDCTIGLTTTGWPQPGATRFTAVDFVDFMGRASPDSKVRYQVALKIDRSAVQAGQLIKQLFGNVLKCAWPGQGSLAVGPDLIWTLSGTQANAFSMYPGLAAGNADKNGLGFKSLRFAPTTPANNGQSGSSGSGPFDKEIFNRAFPAPQNTDSRGNKTGSGVSGDDTETEVSTGVFGVSVGPLTDAGVIELGTNGGIRVTARRSALAVAGFVQAGDLAKTLSGVFGDFDVVVAGSKGDEGPFLTEGGRIVRYGADGATGFARLPILKKPFEITTGHGRFVIEAADPTIVEPGAEAVKPGIVLSTKDNGHLDSFEISSLLRQASIPFPERDEKPSAVEAPRPFFSRLDFAGGDCRFVLDSSAEPVTPLSARSTVRLGGNSSKSPVQLGLDQATLRVVRPDDLLSLTFRFSGLALSIKDKSQIVPLRAGACGVHLAESVNEKLRAGAASAQAFRTGAAVDDRPIMVVEFPPQHVAERAYLRQIDDGEDPPDVALDEDTIEQHYDDLAVLDRYRKGGQVELERRIAARVAIQCAKQAAAVKAARIAAEAAIAADETTKSTHAADSGASDDAKAKAADAKQKAAIAKDAKANAAEQAAKARDQFKYFCERFGVEIQFAPGSDRWPDDQKIYIGSEWLDLDVRRFTRQLAAQIRRENAPKFVDPKTKKSNPYAIDPAVREKLPAVDPRDPDFLAWVAAYDRWGERLFGGLPRYCGPDSVQALVDTGQLDNAGLAMLVAKVTQDTGSPEDFRDEPTEARLSGPSRLAFRINCDDFEGGGGAFPFTLVDLTNWSRFDLAVVRRAEKLLNFNSAGRLPPHWARSEILDAAATLTHQGISPGKSWSSDAKSTSVTAAQRMAEIYASANTPPNPLETAIELPFRLVLSPAQDARWRTPMRRPNGPAPIPLWLASLEEDASRSSLRAVWSEDFQPEALRDGTSPPPHGPWAPWEPPVAQADGGPPHSNKRFRAVMDAGDRHELVTLTSVYGMPVIGRRDQNTGQLLADGNQIEPPPGYAISGLSQPGDAIYSPRTLNVTELALSALGGSLSADTHFEPPAAVTLRNRTNPIFEALDVERWRHTAVLGRDISVEVVYKGFLFPLGNRASFVKLTERRFMQHPKGGPTAYLIQRLFLRIGHPIKNFPALGQANLGRACPPKIINILTRRTPDLVDPTDRPSRPWGKKSDAIENSTALVHEYANGAVTFSTDGMSLLPGLVFWPRTSSSESGNVHFEIQIDGTGGSISKQMLFVDNTAAHWPQALSALADYYNQETLAPKRTTSHNGTPRRYATESKAGDATFETLSWTLKAEGRARPTKDGPVNDDYSFTPPLEGADQPPFYPYLDACSIRLNQVGKFTGGAAPLATARYYPAYVRDGFASPDNPGKNAAEVFLQTIAPLKPADPLNPQNNKKTQSPKDLPPVSFGSSGDRSAGIGRPENQIVALSRKQGPIGGPANHAATGSLSASPRSSATDDLDFSNFDPKSFFGQSANPDKLFGQVGKLLGIIDLGDVIKAVAGLTGAPQLSETIEYYSEQGWDFVRHAVLQPLNDTLDALDKTWTTIVVETTGQTAAQQIANLFPDVKATETALRNAVKDALAAAAPPLDQQATLIGNVYEKARTFIGTLEQLAGDPVGRIELALKDQLNSANVFSSVDIGDWASTYKTVLPQIRTLLNNETTFGVVFAFDKMVDNKLVDSNRIKLGGFIKDELDISEGKHLDILFQEAVIEAAKQLRKGGGLSNVEIQNLDQLVTLSAADWQGALFKFLAPRIENVISAELDIQATVASTIRSTAANFLSALLALAASEIKNLVSGFFDLPLLANHACNATVGIAFDLLAAIPPGSQGPPSSLDKFWDWFKDYVLAIQNTSQQLNAGLNSLQLDNQASQPLKAWADALLQQIKGPLDEIAKQLGELARTPSAAYDPGTIIDYCTNKQFKELNELAGELLNRMKMREALFDKIQTVDNAIIKAFNPPPSFDLILGRNAALAALSIRKALVGLLINPTAGQVRKAVDDIRAQANTLPIVFQGDPDPSMISSQLETAMNKVANATTVAELNSIIQQNVIAFSEAQLGARKALFAGEQALLDQGIAVVVAVVGVADQLVTAAVTILLPVVGALSKICGFLDDAIQRAKRIIDDIASDPTRQELLRPIVPLRSVLTELANSISIGPGSLSSSLRTATDWLNAAKESGADPAKIGKARDSLGEVVKRAGNVVNASEQVQAAITNIGQTALKGQIAQLIDIDAPRRQIEAFIRDLVPHRATMAYSLDTALTPVGDFFLPDTERGGGRLIINTVAVVDLAKGDLAPKTTIKGVLDPVNVHLFGNAFDVVMLKFKQATFGSEPGSNFKFSIDIQEVVLGEMVQFLQALQSYMAPPDGNGFYLRPASGSPGIEVGCGLNLGTISLGPVSFINVSLNAGCRLPFDSSNALFTVSLSRPDSPFLISVGIYGGGGYLGLIANGKTIVGFEASFEFGGVSAFSFGPLTGIGRLTLGIFLRKLYDSTTIEGFFFCGGSARIACFGISASLMVSISQQPGGSMSGQAVFTFTFSVGPAHIEFHITVFKTQSKLGGSASAAPLEPQHTRFAEAASDLPPVRVPQVGRPRVFAGTVSPNRDWSKYRRYFANDITPRGYHARP